MKKLNTITTARIVLFAAIALGLVLLIVSLLHFGNNDSSTSSLIDSQSSSSISSTISSSQKEDSYNLSSSSTDTSTSSTDNQQTSTPDEVVSPDTADLADNSSTPSTPHSDTSPVTNNQASTHIHTPTDTVVSTTREVYVVDQPAWDEETIVGHEWLFSDGYTCSTDEEAAAHEAEYAKKHLLTTNDKDSSGELTRVPGLTSKLSDIKETTHHEEVGHYETVEEQVQQTICSTCGAVLN